MKPQFPNSPLSAPHVLRDARFAFIYLPLVVLILYSFNRDGVGGFPPQHLTFDWYRQLFADGPIWDSVLNSLIVAAGAVALSLTLGLLAALALDRASFPGKALFRRLVLLPLILPGIITGLSLLMFVVSPAFISACSPFSSATAPPSSPSPPLNFSPAFRRQTALRRRPRSISALHPGKPSGVSRSPT